MSHRLIIDDSLPTRQLANGRSIGILEGLGDSFSDEDGEILDGLSDLSGDTLPTVGTGAPAKPTHRIRVKLEGAPTDLAPLSPAQMRDIAARLERGSKGKLTAFYNRYSPYLTAPLGGIAKLKAGVPLVFWYEVDVGLASGVNPASFAREIVKMAAQEQGFLDAGFKVLDVTIDSLSRLAGVVGKLVGGPAMAIIRQIWKPVVLVLVVVGGVYFAPTLKALLPRRSSRIRRRARR